MNFAEHDTMMNIKEGLIKSVRGEPVEPRMDESPAIYEISRSPFDKPVLSTVEGLRANGRLNQSLLKQTAIGAVFWAASSLALAGGVALTPPTPPTPSAQAPAPAPAAAPAPAGPDAEAGAAAYDAGDYDKARHIWQPLAEKGDVRAQRGMGKLYEKGRGVERDFAMAFKWYRPAAEKGDAESQYRLSVGYGYGLGGVKKDEAKAMEWLRKAAENGQKRAQRSLAKGYEDGLNGLPRDPEKAKYWYDRSKTRE